MSCKRYQFEVIIDGQYELRSREFQSDVARQQSAIVEMLTDELMRELMEENPQKGIGVKFLKEQHN